MNKSLWVVSYIEDNKPTVVLFDNSEAAKNCYNWLLRYKQSVEIDEEPIFSNLVG